VSPASQELSARPGWLGLRSGSPVWVAGRARAENLVRSDIVEVFRSHKPPQPAPEPPTAGDEDHPVGRWVGVAPHRV
jgi:hypothetical protein